MRNIWLKAAASDNGGGGCVMWRVTERGIEVGDTKDPDGPTLAFTREEWEAFCKGAATDVWVSV